MDTSLHACGCEVNFVTMPRLKWRLPSDVFRPQKPCQSVNFPKKFPGACPGPHYPSSVHSGTSISKPDQCNFAFAGPAFSWVCLPNDTVLSMHVDARSCSQGVSVRSADKIFSLFAAKPMLFTCSRPTSKCLPTALWISFMCVCMHFM